MENFPMMTQQEMQLIRDELLRRAAQGFEQCGSWDEAAECWVDLGELQRAATLYQQSGHLEQAARTWLEAQHYEEALVLYQQWEEQLIEGDILARVRALLGQAACHALGRISDMHQPSSIFSPMKERQAYWQARVLLASILATGNLLYITRVWVALGEYGSLVKRYDLIQEGYERALEVLKEQEQQEEYIHVCNAYLSAVRAYEDRLLCQALEERLAQAALPVSVHEPQSPSLEMVGTLLYAYQNDEYGFYALVWSPDGRFLSAGGFDGMHIWNAATGEQIVVAAYVAGAACSMAWSPDGKQIVAGYSSITIVDTATLQVILRYDSEAIDSVGWSPDGKRIASGGNVSRVAQIWNTVSRQNLLTYRKHTGWIESIAWSPDSKYVASGSDDKTVQVWDITSGNTLYTHRGHSSFVRAVAWSPDGKRIASGSWDNTVQVWDAFTGHNSYMFRGHSNYVNGLSWAPNGKYIASGGSDETVQIWNAATGQIIFTYTGHTDTVEAVAWSPDGTRIASRSHKDIHVWQAPQ